MSRLDLLITAGEVPEDEIAYSGATTQLVREDLESSACKVCALLQPVHWGESLADFNAMSERWLNNDRKQREGRK